MRWRDVEPELAAVVRAEFERRDVVLVGTLTRDGAPRISGVAARFLDGELWLGMMWQSRKAVDLRRDPRLVLHSPICENSGETLEAIVRGRAVETADRDWFREAVPDPWGELFHLFRVDVETVGTIRYAGGEQHVRVWPGGTELRRRYE